MNRLDHFRRYARDVKTPAELNKAIDELGPLPHARQVQLQGMVDISAE